MPDAVEDLLKRLSVYFPLALGDGEGRLKKV
jgi:hypothetical protein